MEKQTRTAAQADKTVSIAEQTAGQTTEKMNGGQTAGQTTEKANGGQTAVTDCGAACGALPGSCAPLAFPYIPMQAPNPVRYSRMEALETGTLFPGLNLPFKAAIQERTQLSNTALVELMALDFATQELGLYLTTHADDQEALQLYWSYIQMAKDGREKYARLYGPLLETDLTPEDGFAWLKDPWPWE